MATILYLNGTQVYPDGQQSIKLTKENPYFTQSDSYTLDVTLSMGIKENRNFFRNINRIERSKNVERMKCRLVVDNRLLLDGSAKITQISEQEVKVQLLGGNSEINFLSDDEKNYIDNLDLGVITFERNSSQAGDVTYSISKNIRYRQSDIYDETAEARKTCWQFGLVDITKEIFRVFGFEIAECAIDRKPWNEIYVVSAKSTNDVAHVLPHWSLRTFADELCKFFNVSVVIDQEHKTVRIKDNPTFFSSRESIEIVPIDEYSVELNEENDAHALAADNLRFDMSGSEHHDYDMIPDSVRENAVTDTFASRAAAYAAWSAASDDDKKGRIYACPEGKFTGWLHDYSDIGGEEEKLMFTQIDVFAPLVRNPDSDNETELKICPVAFGEIEYGFSRSSSHGITYTYSWKEHIPSMENPTGNDIATRRSVETQGIPNANSAYEATIQEYIEGEASIEKKDKEDRLQVMFMDDVKQPCYFHEGIRNVDEELSVDAGFTDYQYKKAHKSGTQHNLWSLSLNKCEATYYLGQLHENGFTFNLDAKYCIKFLSKEMPDPTKVFIIRNKRYGCEKIEAQIDSQGMQQLMTGYFYEML
ncbi:MAG: hypothetical protein IJ615_11175 [Bacteroidaceae bacterium]|nr:hypothetical protein [Bacteroidaceae bacterium]